MALDILCLTVFLILFLCRFILLSNVATLPQHKHTVFVRDLRILRPVRMAAFENDLNAVDLADRKDRAEAYLHRIVALTGATQTNDHYVVDVGKMRFYVHDKYLVRMRDVTDPECRDEHTCFYVANQDMPAAERIATALLQIKNNPALFDAWLAKRAAFKADGDVFRFGPAQWF